MSKLPQDGAEAPKHVGAFVLLFNISSRHFRYKKKAYLRDKIEELETNSKIQNIRDLYRGINYFKKGYQLRCNIVKDEKGDLVADSHSIVARWRNYFSQLFNVHGVKDVKQAEIHTAEPLVPEPSAAEFELAIDKLKSHKSPGIDQIPAELINPLNAEIYPICPLLALLGAHHILHVSR